MLAGLEALRQSGKLHKAKLVGYKGGLKLVACCPFHQESTPSFAVFESGGYHCKGCGISGLLSRNDGSGDDLLSHLNLSDSPAAPLHSKARSIPEITALEPKLLDLAYRAALSALNLAHTERHHLIGRGLSTEDVNSWQLRGYRSAPISWSVRNAVAAAAVQAIGKDAARSLPFVQPSRRSPLGLICSDIPGLLVPVHNAEGQIIACKVRLIDQGKSRFLWWKARHSSASTGAPIHVHRTPNSTLAIVVEGPIKADLVATLWPRVYGEAVTALAIPGASAHAGLIDTLNQLNIQRVLLALDPDQAGCRATEELSPRLERAGFSVEIASWPEGSAKIDDFLADKSAPHHLLERRQLSKPDPVDTPTPFATMQEARAAARPWLESALLGPSDSVHHMALEMGGGKTHLAVELINQLYATGYLRGQVGLFTTRHEQGEQFQGTSGWARHYGATYGFENGQFTTKSPCHEPRRMLTVINSGAPTKLACEACPQRADCSTNFSRQPSKPFLLAQKTTSKDRHLYNANSLKDPSVVGRLSTIILDDLDLERTLVDRVFLDTDQIRKGLLWSEQDPDYAPIRPLLTALWAALAQVPVKRFLHDSPRLNGEKLQDALATQMGGLEVLREALESAVSSAKDPHPLSPPEGIRGDTPHRGFLRLAHRLLQELKQRGQRDWNPMVHLKADGITLWSRARIDFTGKTVIILNAGDGAEQYQRLFPDTQINVFSGRVVMPDRTSISQVPVGPYTLKRSQQLVDQISQALFSRQAQHPTETPADWGLVTSSGVRDAIEKLFPGINARHYGNQTGSNEMESVRFLIVAGDFKPNPHGFYEEAQAIWGDSPRLENTSSISSVRIQDKTGKSLNRGCRGYLDPRLDARWLELTAGEVRQAVGRGRPWNTGNIQPEQTDLFQDDETKNTKNRHLDILILSSYALTAIVPDQLTGERADLEDVLTAAALKLRRAGKLVTLTALRAQTGLSDRQIRQRFNRVKLRSEAEILSFQAALSAGPTLPLFTLIAGADDLAPPRQHDRSQTSRRGPPEAVHRAVQPVQKAVH